MWKQFAIFLCTWKLENMSFFSVLFNFIICESSQINLNLKIQKMLLKVLGIESIRTYVSYVCIRWYAWQVLFTVHMMVEEEPLLDEEHHNGSDATVDLWY